MSTKKNLFCLFLLVLFAVTSVDGRRTKKSNEIKKILRGIEKTTRRQLADCTFTGESWASSGVLSPFRDFKLRCSHLDEDTVVVRQCDRKCVHPVTCRPLRGVQNRLDRSSVRRLEVKSNRGLGKLVFHLPDQTSVCECVSKKKGSRRKH